MHYISIAENVHDSCITVANDTRVLLHLELERLLNKKRFRIDSVDFLTSLIDSLVNEFEMNGDVQFIIGRHGGERLYSGTIDHIERRFPGSSIFEVEHFDAHAAFCSISGFKDALVIAYDGGGDRRLDTHAVNFAAYLYKDGVLAPVPAAQSPLFDGRVWDVVGYKIFGSFFAAGKVMGLAAYGKFSSEYQDVLLSKNFTHLDRIWAPEVSGRLCSQLHTAGFQDEASLAYTLQELHTRNLVDTLRHYRHLSDNLVVTGGCALNVISNTAVGEQLHYDNVYVPPCPGDEGISLGALLYYFIKQGKSIDVTGLPYLGQGREHPEMTDAAYNQVAAALLDQKTVAWHMGRSEIGPRGLGHRSLLAMPTDLKIKKVVSEQIKKREFFRPVAPVVLEEYAHEWFDFKFDSPFMSFSSQAKEKTKRLAPAVVHEDGTGRLQTVSRRSNPELHEIISRVYQHSGIPMLINTSLNTAGLPICNTEDHSKHFFETTQVDLLNLNGVIHAK